MVWWGSPGEDHVVRITWQSPDIASLKVNSLTAWQRQLIHPMSLDLIISGCANMQQNRDWEGNTRGHSSSHLESVVVVEAWIQVGRGDVDQRLEYGISLPGPQSEGSNTFRTSGVLVTSGFGAPSMGNKQEERREVCCKIDFSAISVVCPLPWETVIMAPVEPGGY